MEDRIIKLIDDLKFKTELVGLMLDLVIDGADKFEVAGKVLDLVEGEE